MYIQVQGIQDVFLDTSIAKLLYCIFITVKLNIEHANTISGVCCGLGAKPPDDKLSEETGEKFAEVRPQGHHLHGDRGGHPRGQPPLRRHTTCEPSLAGHADWCTVNVAGPSHRRLPPDVCGKPLLH